MANFDLTMSFKVMVLSGPQGVALVIYFGTVAGDIIFQSAEFSPTVLNWSHLPGKMWTIKPSNT